MGRGFLALVAITAAVVGVVVAGWLTYSTVTGARLVVFATGSMAPGFPQGSAAVSLPVTATQIEVGDVVTVARGPGQRPVTHRVVEVAPASPALGGTRELVLRGDANDTPDLAPYRVAHAHRVVVGGSALGAAVDLLGHPSTRALLWISAAVAVLWALWPRASKE